MRSGRWLQRAWMLSRVVLGGTLIGLQLGILTLIKVVL